MKFGIEWHRDCLKNRIATYEGDHAREISLHEENVQALIEIQRYKAQIERAEREGRTEFDRDKFNIKRQKP